MLILHLCYLHVFCSLISVLFIVTYTHQLQVGWYDFVENPNPMMKLLRWLWVFFVSMVITTALITQILSCFRRDQVSNGGNGQEMVTMKCHYAV